MKYQIGDTVLILHSNEEGEIIDIINDKMVTVEVKGVKFPVYMDQIDFPYFKRFTEKKMFPPKKEKKYVDDVKKEKGSPQANQVADGVWLTFLPVFSTDEFGDEVVDELKIHLVNRTHTPYNFIYKQNFAGKADFELKNQVQPFENFYLHDVPLSDLSDNPSFDFDFSLLKPDKNKAEHYESSFRLKAKQFFTKIQELRQKNEATFSHRLFEQYPGRPFEDYLQTDILTAKGYKVYNAKEARKHLEPARSVIDLHIEKLVDNWKELDNYAIVDLQLKTFEKYYDLALAHHQPMLTVVHGVGSGRLRDEIHDILRLKREVKSFVNQYDPRFGYGATEIYFQY
jgi:hypothetical protein